MKRTFVILGCNMVWCVGIANAFRLTIQDPMLWVFSAMGALLFIGIIDGWFPDKFPRGDGEDKGDDGGV